MQNFGEIVKRWRCNWRSGVTVALISLPLSISLAVAAGTSPTAGIITAVWAGGIASFLGGSDFNIIGPTGALSGILAIYAFRHGMDSLPMLAIGSGVFILFAYVLRLEKYLAFVPASTVHGFTLGVAIIIGFGQVNAALGLKNTPTHERFFMNILESLSRISSINWAEFSVFVAFLLGLFFFLRFLPRFPGTIILTPLGIILGWLGQESQLPFVLQTLGNKFSDLKPLLVDFPQYIFPADILLSAATVATVAILETMISARIADQMTGTKYKRRREMFGLGVANIASGLAGGIPATAALARTALNVQSGADSRISATINSAVLAVIAILFLSLFRFLPLAVVAAILVFTAVRMVEGAHFSRMWRWDRKGFLLAMFVAGLTVYADPIIGILCGTAISLILFAEHLSKGQFELVVNNENKQIVAHIHGERLSSRNILADTLVYSLKGQLAYINSQAHLERFEHHLCDYKSLILRLRELYFIDLDGVDALHEIIELALARGKKVLISGVRPQVHSFLLQSSAFRRIELDKMSFSRTSEALAALGYPLTGAFHFQKIKP